MSIFIGNKELKECYVGGGKVKEIYVGSTRVWPNNEWVATISSDNTSNVVVSGYDAPSLHLTNGFPDSFGYSSGATQWELANGNPLPFEAGQSYGCYWEEPIYMKNLTALGTDGYITVMQIELESGLISLNMYSRHIEIKDPLGSSQLVLAESANRVFIRSVVGVTKTSDNHIKVTWHISYSQDTSETNFTCDGFSYDTTTKSGFTDTGNGLKFTLAASKGATSVEGDRLYTLADHPCITSLWNFDTAISGSYANTTEFLVQQRRVNDLLSSSKSDYSLTGGFNTTVEEYIKPNTALLSYIRDNSVYNNRFIAQNPTRWQMELNPIQPYTGYPGDYFIIGISGVSIGVHPASNSYIFTVYACDEAGANLTENQLTGICVGFNSSSQWCIYQILNGQIVSQSSGAEAGSALTLGSLIIRDVNGTNQIVWTHNLTNNISVELNSSVWTLMHEYGIGVTTTVAPCSLLSDSGYIAFKSSTTSIFQGNFEQ